MEGIAILIDLSLALYERFSEGLRQFECVKSNPSMRNSIDQRNIFKSTSRVE